MFHGLELQPNPGILESDPSGGQVDPFTQDHLCILLSG